jgi:hypothetical protein
VTRVSRGIDRLDVTFDDPNLVANAGLLVVATLSGRLGLEALIDATVRLVGRVGGAQPGRKVLTLVHAMIAGASSRTLRGAVPADNSSLFEGYQPSENERMFRTWAEAPPLRARRWTKRVRNR